MLKMFKVWKTYIENVSLKNLTHLGGSGLVF